MCLTLFMTTVVAKDGLANHWKFDADYKDSLDKKHAWAIHTDIKGPPTCKTGQIGRILIIVTRLFSPSAPASSTRLNPLFSSDLGRQSNYPELPRKVLFSQVGVQIRVTN